jgi:hypothetical protein
MENSGDPEATLLIDPSVDGLRPVIDTFGEPVDEAVI